MKIYSIQQLDSKYNQKGSSVLTASEEMAKSIRDEWKKDPNLKVTIYVYEVKTQGSNFHSYALAKYFKN